MATTARTSTKAPATTKATPAKAAPAKATTTTTSEPVGTTVTTAEGTPMGQVPALQHLTTTLGLVLANPGAAWPGYGKVVKFVGGTSAYVNRGNIDIRSTPTNVAKWAKAGHGVVRGAGQQYLRMAFSATGR